MREQKKTLTSVLIHCSTNNTLASLVDSKGKLVFTISSGYLKYKGSKKSTQVASQQVIYHLAQKALTLGFNNIIVKIKGIGRGRNSVVKELCKAGLTLSRVTEWTPIPYNGCRIRKGKK
jgi:small subunit ribosomal protein S11